MGMKGGNAFSGFVTRRSLSGFKACRLYTPSNAEREKLEQILPCFLAQRIEKRRGWLRENKCSVAVPGFVQTAFNGLTRLFHTGSIQEHIIQASKNNVLSRGHLKSFGDTEVSWRGRLKGFTEGVTHLPDIVKNFPNRTVTVKRHGNLIFRGDSSNLPVKKGPSKYRNSSRLMKGVTTFSDPINRSMKGLQISLHRCSILRRILRLVTISRSSRRGRSLIIFT
jgi:hypothetical protein